MIFARRKFRPVAGFVLLALLLGALVPAGFMPGPGKSGRTQIVICTGHGSAVRTVDAAQLPPGVVVDTADGQGGKDSEASRFTCPYAPVLAQNVTLFPPSVLPLPQVRDVSALLPADAPFRRAALKPWHAQGPPSAHA